MILLIRVYCLNILIHAVLRGILCIFFYLYAQLILFALNILKVLCIETVSIRLNIGLRFVVCGGIRFYFL